MTRRLITAVAVLMAFAAATAYAAITTIPPDQYPPGCRPNGSALRGDERNNTLDDGGNRNLLRGAGGDDDIRGGTGMIASLAERGAII
jgi:hypothetical protein